MLLAWQPAMTMMGRVWLEQLRQWLHGQAVPVWLPAADQVQWLDGLWREAFGGG